MSPRTSSGRVLRLCALGVLLSVTVACGGTSDKAVQEADALPSTSATTECPAPTQPAADWPSGVPSELPVFAGMQVTGSEKRGDLLVVDFTAPLSLHDAVVAIVQQLPKAGFTLGRGDSESHEADAPFSGHGVRGQFKLQAGDGCQLTGILALADESSSATPQPEETD